MTGGPNQTVASLDATWRTIASLCEGLDEAGFLTPTELPGWTVKDILSHILGTERSLRGETPPDIDARGDHVRNDLGAFNERWVESLRRCSGAEVLARFREVTEAQAADRYRLTPQELAAVGPTVFGEMPLEQWLNVRLFDSFSHEQDIRRTLHRPGNLDGEPARRAVLRGASILPRAAGKAARGMPNGVRVETVVDGTAGGRWVVVVTGGRGALEDGPSEAGVDAGLRADAGVFLRLVWGRVSPEIAEHDGGLAVSGDRDLARRVAAGLNITP
jgi:uncharacterized protein (TIGR03083 family)